MTGLQLSNRAISRERSRNADERQIIMNRFVIDVATDARVLQQGIELGTEDQLSVELGVQQRLLSHAIARQEKRFGAFIPNRKRKHPAQVLWTIGSPLVVGVNDSFSIAVGIELVAELFEFFAQLAIVVDLAVENNPCRAVLIMNRLLSVREIDDREPSHRQSHAIAEIETVIVRTAMTNGLIHAREQLAINRSAVFVNYSCNATHGLLRPFLKNLVHHHLQNQAGPAG